MRPRSYRAFGGVATGCVLAALVAFILSAAATGATGKQTNLTIALSGEPRTLDVLLDSDSAADAFDRNVYEGLTTRNAAGQVVPQLATSWQQHGNVWTFHLRKGVTFHNGQKMTATDVVASFNRVLDPKLQSLIRQTYIPTVAQVTRVDNYTVDIKTSTATPILPANIALVGITTAAYAAASNNAMISSMMGTGPYKFVRWSRGREIDLTKYANYWGTPGQFNNVKFTFLPDPSVRLSALKTGEINVAEDIPPALASQTPKVASGPGSSVLTMRLAQRPGDPLANPQLRKALNLAIYRKAIIAKLLDGQGTLTHGNVVVPGSIGYNSSLKDYPFEPALAKQIVTQQNAVGTKLTFMIPNGRFINDIPIGQAIAQELDNVGFDVKVEVVDVSVWGQAAFAPGRDPSSTPDLTYFELSNDLLNSANVIGNYRCNPKTYQLSAQCVPGIDRILAKVDRASTLKQYDQFLEQAAKLNYDAYAFLPVGAPNQVWGISKNLSWTPRPQGFIYLSDIHVTG